MRKLAIGVLLVVLAACSSGGASRAKPRIPKTFYFAGDVKLSGAENVRGDLASCVGVGRYADIFKGASVTIAKPSGKPVALGTITTGLGTNVFRDVLDECTFRFTVVGVPRARSFRVTIGRQSAQFVPLEKVLATGGKIQLDANPPIVPPAPGAAG